MATANSPRAGLLGSAERAGELILPIGIMASILVILVPMRADLMSLLLSANIAAAVIILLTTIYVRTPLEFSVFPTLLLAATLARLVLNVATTRLILTHAQTDKLDAAGGVVRAFGEFVAGDNVAVGLVIFSIIVVIQFVVITKGATRISEVAARFALDGMPGRQMAIDADVAAGTIDHAEARRRREQVAMQADFFGAMDGASKFVRGDAIAGLIITMVNILGGLFIGIVQAHMSAGEAASIFTKLTIGDGLVTQVPALLTSMAAGLLVTRSTTATNLPGEFVRQVFCRPQALAVAGVFLGVLVFTSLPRLPLILMGSSCAALAIVLSRRARAASAQAEAESRSRQAASKDPRVEDYLATDPIEIELGVGLLRLADARRGGDLLQRIQSVRREVASQIGIILPKVRLRDNLGLARDEYRIKLSGAPVAGGEVVPGACLAISSTATAADLPGEPTEDPASGRPAIWIEPVAEDRARASGCAIMDAAGALAGHLMAVVRDHADELLTRDATKHLIDELRRDSPVVVDELIPGVMRLAEVQQVLQMLLAERAPIRPLGLILEALGVRASQTKDPTLLTEHVRGRLARTLCAAYRDEDGVLHVATLDPAIEDQIREYVDCPEGGFAIRTSPAAIDELCRRVAADVEPLVAEGRPPVLLVNPQLRPAVRRITASRLPRLVVLGYNEITRDTRVESVAMVGV